MDERTFGQEMAEELTAKAVIWGPGIAGAILLGPVGILLGLVATAVIVESVSSSSRPPGSDQSQGRNMSSK